MKQFYRIILFLSLLFAALPAAAQISIDAIDAPSENVSFRDKLKSMPVETEYFNLARYKAERAAIRKERNYLEFGGGVQGALTSYNDSWVAVSGGDNSIALTAVFNLKHIFTKNDFSIETKFNAKLGYNRMKVETEEDEQGIWFKNQDEFEISTAPKFKMSKNWAYGAIVKFRSQFVNGYKSRTEQEREDLKSRFMTPGYLDVSLGFTYTSPKPKFPIAVNLSPIALNATFAENDWIRRRQVDGERKEIKPAYSYGIEDPDKTSKYEGGSSIQIDFDRKFGKSEFLRYRTMIYAFYGWITDIGQKNKISDYHKYLDAYAEWDARSDKSIKDKPRLPIHPIVRWTNTIDIKATKYLSTTLSFELYYNRSQSFDVQTKTLLSVGLTYTFKNK